VKLLIDGCTASAFTTRLQGIRRRIDSPNHQEFKEARQKERGARKPHKRLLYYFNVNRTSLDHLLLGGNADVDRNVEWSEYSAGRGNFQNKRFLNLWA
jgi:hypothetical protein